MNIVVCSHGEQSNELGQTVSDLLEIEFEVSAEQAGTRIDSYLAESLSAWSENNPEEPLR